ncbi:MAG: T9SS type A sorting domain-containing protein [Bacteroidetes bacterium]|nr:T9SS type A sorting domain-containing protein [Bacteroidota bacterium]
MKYSILFLGFSLMQLFPPVVINPKDGVSNNLQIVLPAKMEAQTSAPTDFFESNADGDWDAPSSWKSSSVSNSGPWTIPATSVPTNNAQGIVIKHAIKISAGTQQTAKLLVIANGGTLIQTSTGDLSLYDEGTSATDFLIQNGGVYELHGLQPIYVNNPVVIIENGGIARANSNASGESDDFARQTNVYFNTGAVMEWKTSQPFQTGNMTYFPNATINDHAIFRITSTPSGAFGSNTSTTFNGKFEVASGYTFTFWNKGDKIFRDGLGGDGTLVRGTDNARPCGAFKITGTNAVIDGNLNLQLGKNNFNSNALEITNGAFVTVSDPNIHIGTISNPGGTLLMEGTLNISSGINMDIQYGNIILNGNMASSSSGAFLAGTSPGNTIKIIVGGSNGSAGVLKFKSGYDFIDSFTMNRTGTSTPRIILGTSLTANEFVLISGKIVTGNNLISWNNAGPTSQGNKDSYFATCTVTNDTDEKGTPLSFALPFSGDVGLRILNVNNEFPIYFPAGPNLESFNKVFLQNESTLSNNPFTVSIAIGDIGNTPLPRVNRIWYIHESLPGTSSADMRLYFTKHTITSGFPVDQDEVEFGFDYDDCHLIQETYANQFIHNANGADIMQYASAPDLSEIYARYSRGISYGLDGDNNGIDTFSRFSIVNAQGIVLPVKMTAFNVYEKNLTAHLSWKIFNENQIKNYVIESSVDGKKFTKIGIIYPQRIFSQEKNYHFMDSFPFSGENFYRIKMTSENNMFHFSEIKKILIRLPETFADIFPNPISSKLPDIRVRFHQMVSGNLEVSLYNIEGIIVDTKHRCLKNSFVESFQLKSSLIPGIYFLKIKMGDAIQIKQLLIH